jgi:hypothetical protein
LNAVCDPGDRVPDRGGDRRLQIGVPELLVGVAGVRSVIADLVFRRESYARASSGASLGGANDGRIALSRG